MIAAYPVCLRFVMGLAKLHQLDSCIVPDKCLRRTSNRTKVPTIVLT